MNGLEVVGTVSLIVITVVILAAILVAGVDCYRSEGKVTVVTFFDFGVVVVKKTNDKLLYNLRLIRKDDDAGILMGESIVFVNAPLWFSNYVYNVGVKP